MKSSEFDNYIIYHEQKKGDSEKAVITCFMGERTVGYINFYDGGVPDPEVLPNGVLKICFHHSRISEIVNTIRYEKPLYISIYEDKGVLSTVREPVGEQEGNGHEPI